MRRHCRVFHAAWLPEHQKQAPMGLFLVFGVLLTFPTPTEHPKHTAQACFTCLASSTPLVLPSTRKMRRLCRTFHAGWLPSTAADPHLGPSSLTSHPSPLPLSFFYK